MNFNSPNGDAGTVVWSTLNDRRVEKDRSTGLLA
jgi:hypothetical protein